MTELKSDNPETQKIFDGINFTFVIADLQIRSAHAITECMTALPFPANIAGAYAIAKATDKKVEELKMQYRGEMAIPVTRSFCEVIDETMRQFESKIPPRPFVPPPEGELVLAADGVYYKGNLVKKYSKSSLIKQVQDFLNADKTRK